MDEVIKELKANGKYWMVFTGDSISSCEWVHPNWRDMVIYALQQEVKNELNGDWKTPEWGIKGFNFAYDGATTGDIYERKDDILLVKPNMVICLVGGNDPAMGVSVEESVDNISKFADEVIDGGARLVWSSSISAGIESKKNAEYEPYARAVREMPEKNGLTKIDMFNIYQSFPTEKFFTFISEENQIEGVKAGEVDLQHPNQLGNAYIAKVILGEVFGIQFNPERYIKETLGGEKYPGY